MTDLTIKFHVDYIIYHNNVGPIVRHHFIGYNPPIVLKSESIILWMGLELAFIVLRKVN